MYAALLKNSKNIFLFILIILAGYTASSAISGVLAEKTLGSVFRHFLPTMFFLVLILLVSQIKIESMTMANPLPDVYRNFITSFSLRKFIIVISISIVASIFSIKFLFNWGLLIGPVVFVLLLVFFYCCFLMLNNNTKRALQIFLLAIPFLFFIQGQLGLMEIGDIQLSGVTIPLSAMFLTGMILFYFLGQLRFQPGTKKKMSSVNKVLVLMLILPVFSILFSINMEHSGLYYVLDLFLPIMFFFILCESIKTFKDIKTLVMCLIIVAFLYEFIALYFLYQQRSASAITIDLYHSQALTHFSPVLISLILPFQIAMIKIVKGWKKIIIASMVVGMAVFLFFSNYRTAFLGIVIGFFVFFIFFYRVSILKKAFFSVLVFSAFIALFLYSEEVIERLQFFRFTRTIEQISAGEPLEVILGERAETWGASIKMIRDHPILGISPDMWDVYIKSYSIPMFPYRDPNGNFFLLYAADPHNLYLLIWVNYGVLVILLYIVILFITIKKTLATLRTSKNDASKDRPC